MPTADQVIEAPRAVVDGQEQGCTVLVRDGRIVGVEELGAPAGRGRDECGSTTTWCCCPAWSTPTCTATTRAGAHWEGFAARHPGGRRRRGDHDRRHAAQQRAADRRRRGAGREARGRGRPVLRRRGLLGRRGPRQRRRPAAAAGRRACSASSASWSTRGCEEFPPLDRAGLHRRCRGRRVVRRAAARARRGPRRLAAGPRAAATTPGSPRAGRRRPRGSRSRRWSPPPGRTGCRVHVRAPRGRGGPALSRAAQRRRRPRHRRDLPALPDPHRDGGTRRATPPSSAARRSATTTTATALWAGLARRDDRHGRVRPLALPGGPEAARRPAASPTPGAVSARSSSGCRHLDRGPAARARAGRRGALDGRGARPTWPACGTRAGSPRAPTRTCACSRPTRRSSSTRPARSTGTRSRRTPDGRSPASSARPGWRGRPVDLGRAATRAAAAPRRAR